MTAEENRNLIIMALLKGEIYRYFKTLERFKGWGVYAETTAGGTVERFAVPPYSPCRFWEKDIFKECYTATDGHPEKGYGTPSENIKENVRYTMKIIVRRINEGIKYEHRIKL